MPKLGRFTIENGDTIHHKIPDFQFVNQDSVLINNQSFADKIYIADFFFMSCPTICPRVTEQMLRIYKSFEDDHRVQIVSHTIDPKRDTPSRLKAYAENMNVNSEKWWFLWGDKDEILEIAEKYFVVAYEDPDTPGGFEHSGKIILIDEDRHIRAFCEGTDPESVDAFIPTVKQLLEEMNTAK